jgi:hypothetical protein
MTTQEEIAQKIHDKCDELTLLLRDARHVGLKAVITHRDSDEILEILARVRDDYVFAVIIERRSPPKKFLRRPPPPEPGSLAGGAGVSGTWVDTETVTTQTPVAPPPADSPSPSSAF